MNRPEEQLQRTVVAYLRAVVPPPPAGPWWTHPHNEGFRSKAEAGIAKAMGQRAGTPDLLFCFRGRFVGIELKAPTGRVSENQRTAHDEITLAGGVVTVCRSLDEVRDFLDALGVPRRDRGRGAP